MAYITKDQMIARYGADRLVQLTDREKPYTGGMVDAVLDQAIASADSIIDLHLSRRCQLPLASVPPAVADIAATLTLAGLHVDTAPEKVTADFQQAMRTLRAIADGTLRLDVAGAEPPPPQPVGIETVAPPRVFGRDNLRNW